MEDIGGAGVIDRASTTIEIGKDGSVLLREAPRSIDTTAERQSRMIAFVSDRLR